MTASPITPSNASRRNVFDYRQWSRQLLALAALLAIAGAGLAVMGSKLPALACLAAGSGLVLLLKPDVATLVVTLGLYTNAAGVATQFHGVPKAAAAGLFLLLAVPLYYHVFVCRKKIVFAPALPWVTLFAVVQLAGMMLALRSEVAVAVVITMLSEGLILYLLVTNVIRDKTTLRRVIWTLLLAGSFLGALSAVQQLTKNFDSEYGGFAQVPVDPLAEASVEFTEPPRAAGSIGEKNYYAQFMLLLLPLGLTFALIERRPAWRMAAIAASALIALAIALTASRAAALAAVVMVIAMAAWQQIRMRHIALFAVAALVIVLASPQLRERMARMTDLASFAQGEAQARQVDKSTQGRFSEALAAALIFADHPIAGVGPGNFPSQFLKKADAMGFQVHTEERLAHCAVLEIAAESGIIGLLCIAGVFVISFRELSRARRLAVDPELRSLTTAFLVILVVLVFSSLFLSFAYVRYYWLMLALAAVVARLVTEGDHPSDHETLQPARAEG